MRLCWFFHRITPRGRTAATTATTFPNLLRLLPQQGLTRAMPHVRSMMALELAVAAINDTSSAARVSAAVATAPNLGQRKSMLDNSNNTPLHALLVWRFCWWCCQINILVMHCRPTLVIHLDDGILLRWPMTQTIRLCSKRRS